MIHDQLIITLWSHEGDLAQMNIQYNKTFLSANLIIQSTKFVLEHNTKPKCFWNVRFVQTRVMLPKNFYEQFSNKVLLTRRVLSTYGVKDEGNFYNNLEFDGASVEEKNAREFVAECAKAHLRFVDEASLTFPTTNTNDHSNDIPEEKPLPSFFENVIEITASKPFEANPLYAVVKVNPITIKFLEDCSQEKKEKVLKEWDAVESSKSTSIGILFID